MLHYHVLHKITQVRNMKIDQRRQEITINKRSKNNFFFNSYFLDPLVSTEDSHITAGKALYYCETTLRISSQSIRQFFHNNFLSFFQTVTPRFSTEDSVIDERRFAFFSRYVNLFYLFLCNLTISIIIYSNILPFN